MTWEFPPVDLLVLKDLAQGGEIEEKIDTFGDFRINLPNDEYTYVHAAIVWTLQGQGLVRDGRITDAGRAALAEHEAKR